MPRIRWTQAQGFRSYTSDDGQVHIDYCANAPGGKWRVRDDRYLPAHFTECMYFARTLAEAKAWANGKTRTV
jgi:hypothetical protein